MEAQEPHMLAVGLLPFYCGGSQTYPGTYMVHKGYILCQNACVRRLLEKSAIPNKGDHLSVTPPMQPWAHKSCQKCLVPAKHNSRALHKTSAQQEEKKTKMQTPLFTSRQRQHGTYHKDISRLLSVKRLTGPTALTHKTTSRDSLEASPWYVFPDHSQSSPIVQVVVLLLPHAFFLLQCHPKSTQAPHASAIPLYHADIQAAAVEGSLQHTLPWLACLRRALMRKS